MFGQLTVLEYLGRQGHNTLWNCRCDCGRVIPIYGTNLLRGMSTKCRRHPSKYKTFHRLTYSSWQGMKSRCKSFNGSTQKAYSARGITICSQWQSFEKFLEDMGERPGKDYSLERIDVNKGYSPENCKWLLSKFQNRNKRNNRILTYNGESQPLCVWAERLGVQDQVISKRLSAGWPVAKAVTTPPRQLHRSSRFSKI